MNVYFGPLVKVIGVPGILVAHDRICDERIDFDPVDVGAAVRNSAQDVDSPARANDGEVAAWTQPPPQGGECVHELSLPVKPTPPLAGGGVPFDGHEAAP